MSTVARRTLPPIHHSELASATTVGVDLGAQALNGELGRGHGQPDVERMLLEARKAITDNIRQLVDHAGEVQSQLEKELGQVRQAGSTTVKVAQEAYDMTASFSSTQQSLNDRINNLEMIIRTKDAELSRTATEKEELNKTIYNLNKDLEQEQRTRSLRIDELKRELEQEKSAHQRIQQAIRRINSIMGDLPNI